MRKIMAVVLAATVLALGAGCAALDANGGAKMSGKKLIAAKVFVKADKVDVFIAASKSILAASRAEPGCISYTLYQNPHERTSFFFFEEWQDQAAIDFHFATPHFKAFGDQIKDLVSAPPEITIFDATATPPAK